MPRNEVTLNEVKEWALLKYFRQANPKVVVDRETIWRTNLFSALSETRENVMRFDWLEDFLSRGWDLRDIADAIESMALELEHADFHVPK